MWCCWVDSVLCSLECGQMWWFACCPLGLSVSRIRLSCLSTPRHLSYQLQNGYPACAHLLSRNCQKFSFKFRYSKWACSLLELMHPRPHLTHLNLQTIYQTQNYFWRLLFVLSFFRWCSDQCSRQIICFHHFCHDVHYLLPVGGLFIASIHATLANINYTVDRFLALFGFYLWFDWAIFFGGRIVGAKLFRNICSFGKLFI